jgi:hypothetical protein
MGEPRQLRQLSLGGVLDVTVLLYRRNFMAFVRPLFILIAPLAIIVLFGIVFGDALFDWDSVQVVRPNLLLMLEGVLWGDSFTATPTREYSWWETLLYLFGYAILLSLLIRTAVHAYLDNVPIAVGVSRQGFSREMLLIPVAALLLPIYNLSAMVKDEVSRWVLLAEYWLSPDLQPLLFGFLTTRVAPRLALGLVVVMLLTPLIFTAHAILLEGRDLADGMKRSLALARVGYPRALFCVLAICLLSGVLPGLATLMGELAVSRRGMEALALVVAGTFGLTSLALQILLYPLLIIAATVLYYDLRARSEGYDIEYQLWQDVHFKATALQARAEKCLEQRDLAGAQIAIAEAIAIQPENVSLHYTQQQIALAAEAY